MALDPKQQAGRAAGKEGPVGELPRGLARFGWDQPPHLYDSPPPPGHERGSAWNLVQMAARALQDPCLEQRVAVLRGGGNRPPDYPAFPPSDPRPPFIIRPPRPNPGGGGNLGGGRVPGELVGGRMGAFSAAAAQISFAPAGTLVNEPADQESALGGRVWTHCELRPRFEKDKGRVARTEQKAGGKTVVVQTRAERVRYVVEWTAERVGAPPEVPPEDHEDANFSLLKSDWSPGVVTVADDGVTLIYTAAGRYEYAVLDPSKLKPGAVMEPAVAEVFGKGTAPILAGGPVLIDPTRKSDLTSGRAAGTVEEEWEKELKRWAGT